MEYIQCVSRGVFGDTNHLGIFFFSLGSADGKRGSVELRFLVASSVTPFASSSMTFYTSAG